MIIDVHAHAFPYVGDKGMYGSVEQHLHHLQLNMAIHPQGARRFHDNIQAAEPTLWDGKIPGSGGLLEVGFRVGRFGRFEWEKDGDVYYIQFFPPTLDNMVATPERMLAQMQYVGVNRTVLQFAKLYGITYEYMSEIVHKWPDKFRCCTAVNEREAHRREQIDALRHSVLNLGMTALYFSAPSDGIYLDDESYLPFWDEVEVLKIPVIWDIRSAARRWDHGFYMAQVARLHRHLKRFPKIQNILSHGMPANAFDETGNMPNDLWSMFREPNIIVELLIPLLYGAKWEYPYVEAQPMIRQLYERLGPTKLIWGSDMPNVERSCTYLQSVDYLRKHCTFISQADMDMILGTNANELFFSITPSVVETAGI
jgi:predicted TIM-barrel fold metal-dependent hydrolase